VTTSKRCWPDRRGSRRCGPPLAVVLLPKVSSSAVFGSVSICKELLDRQLWNKVQLKALLYTCTLCCSLSDCVTVSTLVDAMHGGVGDRIPTGYEERGSAGRGAGRGRGGGRGALGRGAGPATGTGRGGYGNSGASTGAAQAGGMYGMPMSMPMQPAMPMGMGMGYSGMPMQPQNAMGYPMYPPQPQQHYGMPAPVPFMHQQVPPQQWQPQPPVPPQPYPQQQPFGYPAPAPQQPQGKTHARCSL
jgi:hypothetical protein